MLAVQLYTKRINQGSLKNCLYPSLFSDATSSSASFHLPLCIIALCISHGWMAIVSLGHVEEIPGQKEPPRDAR